MIEDLNDSEGSYGDQHMAMFAGMSGGSYGYNVNASSSNAAGFHLRADGVRVYEEEDEEDCDAGCADLFGGFDDEYDQENDCWEANSEEEEGDVDMGDCSG